MLSIIGTTESGDVIEIFTDSSCTDKPIQSISNGGITLTLSENKTFAFYTKQSDQVGNQAPCATTGITYTLDTIAPSLFFQLLTSSPSNITTPVLSIIGTIESGDVIEIFTDSSCTDKPIQSISSGQITLTLSGSNTYAFYTKQSDQVGNQAPCATTGITYTLNNASGTEFSITLAADSGSVQPEFTLNNFSSDRVEIFHDSTCGNLVGEFYESEPTFFERAADLPHSNTPYHFYYILTDSIAGSCTDAGITYTLAQETLNVPTIIITTDNKFINGYYLSNQSNITFQFSDVSSGNRITFYSGNNCNESNLIREQYEPNIQPTSQSVIVNTTVAYVDYYFSAKQGNTNGTDSACTSITYRLDSTAPPPTLELREAVIGSEPNAERVFTFTISDIETEATVALYKLQITDPTENINNIQCDDSRINQVVDFIVPTNDSNGKIITYSETPDDEIYVYFAKQKDQAENESSCSAPFKYQPDTTPPSFSLSYSPTLLPQSPEEKQKISSEVTFKVYIHGDDIETGDEIKIYTKSNCTLAPGQTTDTADKSITITVSASDHIYNFYMKASDKFLNETSCINTELIYEVDRTPPLKITLGSLPATSMPISELSITNNLEPEGKIAIYHLIPTTEQQRNNPQCTDATLLTSFTTPIDNKLTIPSATIDETHIYFAKQKDLAENESPCSDPIEYQSDNTPPSVTIALKENSLTVSNQNPIVNAQGIETGDIIKIFSDNLCTNEITPNISGEENTLVNGENTLELSTTITTNTLYTFYTTKIDEWGNEIPCNSTGISYTLNNILPRTLGLVLNNSNANNTYNERTPEFTISNLDAGNTVELYQLEITSTEQLSSIQCDDSRINEVSGIAINGNIITIPSIQEDNIYVYFAKQTDSIGNESVCSNKTEYYLDTIPPNVIITVSGGKSISNQNPVMSLSGVKSGDIIKIFSDSLCANDITPDIPGQENTLADGDTLSLLTSSPTDITYNFHTIQKDGIGHEVACADTGITYTLDTIPPDAVVLSNLSSKLNSPATLLYLAEDIEPGAIVSIYHSSRSPLMPGDIPDCSSSTFLTNPPFNPNTNTLSIYAVSPNNIAIHTFFARQRDLAGNISNDCSNRVEYQLYSQLLINGNSTSTDTRPRFSLNYLTIGETISVYSDTTCTNKILSVNIDAKSMTPRIIDPLPNVQTYSFSTIQTYNGTPLPCLNQGVNYVLRDGLQQLYAGNEYTCSTTNKGEAYCWGLNDNGQLGNNSTTNSIIPVKVKNGTGTDDFLSDIKHFSVGKNHTCSTISDGTAYCWGLNDNGQLGNNSTTMNTIAVQVKSGTGTDDFLTNVKKIAVGHEHTCAILNDNTVSCWGAGTSARLGTQSDSDSYIATPTTVLNDISGTSVDEIFAGSMHTCVLLGTGAVRCWGEDSDNKLAERTNVKQLSVGDNHNCAIFTDDPNTAEEEDGTVECWGLNTNQQLGNISNFTNVAKIAAGSKHSCTISGTGDQPEVKCWGANGSYQLGVTGTTQTANPQNVPSPALYLTSYPEKISEVSLGGNHSCVFQLKRKVTYPALFANDIRCWGSNEHGQFGAVDSSNDKLSGGANSSFSAEAVIRVTKNPINY